jgi:hypothetical protein
MKQTVVRAESDDFSYCAMVFSAAMGMNRADPDKVRANLAWRTPALIR